jgi:hypothetical protein
MHAGCGTYTMMTKLYSGKIQQGFSDRLQFCQRRVGAKRKDDETSLSIVHFVSL